MGFRLVPVVLLALLAVLHAQLWLGRGSIPRVQEMQRQLDEQIAANDRARQANERLNSEVQSSARQTMEMLAKSFGAQQVAVDFSNAEPRKTQLVDSAAVR